MATVKWDGGGSDNFWSTAQNWDGDVVPGNGDDVVFDATSSKDCIIDVLGGAFATLTIDFYTGTITSLGTADLDSGDTTVRGSATVDFSGLNSHVCANFTVDDTDGTPTFTACPVWSVAGTFIQTGSPVVNMGSGTVTFYGATDAQVSAPDVVFNKIVINKTGKFHIAAGTVPLGANPTVSVSSSFPGLLIDGTLTASGVITFSGGMKLGVTGTVSGSISTLAITDGFFYNTGTFPATVDITFAVTGAIDSEFGSDYPIKSVTILSVAPGGTFYYLGADTQPTPGAIGTFTDNVGSVAHTIAFDTFNTYTFGAFNVMGSAGKLVSLMTIQNDGNVATLTTTGGTVICDYLSVKDSTVDASPNWYAGSHSTNVSGNTNWIFSDPGGPVDPGTPVGLPGTVLYFPAAEAAAVSPPLAPGWDRISESLTRRLSRSRTSEDAADDLQLGSIIGPWTAGQYALDRRYISDEIETQLISGEVMIQIMMQEIGSTFDVTPVVQMYVIKPDGSVRGTMIRQWTWRETSENSDSYGPRNFTIIKKRMNSVFAKKGDRIVICVGHTDRTGLGNRAQSLWGVNGPGSGYDDLPANDDTQQAPLALPWVNFNREIFFLNFIAQPGVEEDTTDKSFSWPTTPVHIPGTAVPDQGIDEQLFLVKPTGTPATGFTFQIMRQLDGTYQRIEWWAHRNGGCGSFRLHLRETFPEQDPAIEDGWEIWVKVRLPAESAYRLWYRGVIRSVHAARGGNEVITEIRGYGYVEQLNFIQVQKTYPKGMSVSDVVNDIFRQFIRPHTRVVRPNELYPTDDSGVDVSNYQLRGDTHFECSALKALKFLAELQGSREWGVDERRCFFFRNNSTMSGIKSFYLGKDSINMVGGGKAFDRLNQMKVQGKQFTGREYLRVRPDVTDVTRHGLFERAQEVPWVTHDDDANRWADNIIAQHEARESWVNFTWQGIDYRLDGYHPMGKAYYYGHDTSNEKQLLSVGKIQYVKGGFPRKGEVKEIGNQTQQTDMHMPVLTATIYLGAWRKDLIEELERNVYDPLAAIQGKLRQFRNPNNDAIFPSEGRVVGEAFALWCPTEQRGTRWQWDGTEWVAQQQVRRGLVLPTRGIFQGQEFFLITDVTNQTGTMYWWDGSTWKLFGEGTGSSSSFDLVHEAAFWMFSG